MQGGTQKPRPSLLQRALGVFAVLALFLGLFLWAGKEIVQRWQAWARSGDLPALFAELMTLHYDPHYGRSQARHFSDWPRRCAVASDDLSDQGIAALADAVLAQSPAEVNAPPCLPSATWS